MDKLNEIAIFLLNTLKDTKDFVLAQAPDVIRQMLNYYFWLDLVQVVAGILIPLIWGICAVSVYKRYYKKLQENCNEPGYWLFAGIGSLAAFILSGCFLSTFSELLQVVIAPKLFLIEHLASLAHK